jgi:hypothetical protein
MRGPEQKQKLSWPKSSDYSRAYSYPVFRHTWSLFRISHGGGTRVSTIIRTRPEIVCCPMTIPTKAIRIGGATAPRRRLALVSYFHDEWRSDWGGELIIYAKRKAHVSGSPTLKSCTVSSPGLARS